jgi:hypothetical protein
MRRILLAWSLLLAGVFCLLQQPMPKAYWQSRAQSAAGTSCTAPTLDANVNAVQFADWSSGTSFSLTGLTSTGTNVVAVLFLETNGLNTAGTITPTTTGLSWGVSFATAGTWSGSNRSATDGSSSFAEFVATSSSALSSATILITYNQTPTFATAQAFVVDGTKFSAPFDTGSVPNALTGAANATVATNGPCNMIFNGVAETGTAVPSAPWTQVLQRNFMFTQYARFTTGQSSFTIPQGSGGSSAKAIGDAFQSP